MTHRLASRWKTLFTTVSSRPTSWLMTTSPPLWVARYPRSHTIESASRWFVGSSRSSVLGLAEQDPGQLDAPALTAGEGAQRLAEVALGDPQAGGDRGRLRLGRVPVEGQELGLGPVVAPHRVVADIGIGVAHRRLRAPQPPDHVAQPTGIQDALARALVHVPGARILGQVPDAAAAGHRPGLGDGLPGEDAHQGGLAGTVAPHQAHPVTVADPDRHARHEQAGAGPYLQLSVAITARVYPPHAAPTSLAALPAPPGPAALLPGASEPNRLRAPPSRECHDHGPGGRLAADQHHRHHDPGVPRKRAPA